MAFSAENLSKEDVEKVDSIDTDFLPNVAITPHLKMVPPLEMTMNVFLSRK